MPEEIRIPKQKRSIEKKEALKKAAVELFSTKGFHNRSEERRVGKECRSRQKGFIIPAATRLQRKQMCRSAHFTVILLIRSRYMRN